MSDGTKIEWTDATWNVVNGCSVVSPGCANCYAMKLAGTRLKHHPSRVGLTQDSKAGPVWNGKVRFNEKVLLDPLRWKQPRKIFVCAHGDLFHHSVPDEWIDRVFAVMALCPQHIFQVLTKRPDRMRQWFDERWQGTPARSDVIAGIQLDIPAGPETGRRHQVEGSCEDIIDQLNLADTDKDDLWTEDGSLKIMQWQWPLSNVWLGTSVEDQKRADERIPDLLATPAAVRFLSCEPLLGPVNLSEVCGGHFFQNPLTGHRYHDAPEGVRSASDNEGAKINWVIVGGENGPRPMHPLWARSLRDQCRAADVPFFFKQWGTWAPISEMDDDAVESCYLPAPVRHPDATRRCKVRQCVLHASGDRFSGSAMFERPAFDQGTKAMTMMAIGKKAAGRLLDGVQHDGMPG